MHQFSIHTEQQLSAVEAALMEVLGDALVALYLHGSVARGGLRPQSDVDLLAIANRRMTRRQRSQLTFRLKNISAKHPVVSGHARCIELIVFLEADLSRSEIQRRAEFVYGEWLRGEIDAGKVPMPTRDADYTLVLAQARIEGITLQGKCASETLPSITLDEVRDAIGEILPGLLDEFDGDERNVVLTLCRMWHTLETGEFVAKDAAAAWVIPQVSSREAEIVSRARKGYLGEVVDIWAERCDEVSFVVGKLRKKILSLL